MGRYGYSEAAHGAYLMQDAQNNGYLKTAEYDVKYAVEPSKTHTEQVVVTVWVGKAKRPTCRYRVKDVETAMSYVTKAVEQCKAHEESKAKYKAERKARTAETAKTMVPGTILKYSWGYEQTQVEFYQVVAKTGAMVTVRRIASKTVEATGPMSSKVSPVKDKFIGGAFKKRVGAGALSMEHGCAYPVAEDSAHHCSWYY